MVVDNRDVLAQGRSLQRLVTELLNFYVITHHEALSDEVFGEGVIITDLFEHFCYKQFLITIFWFNGAEEIFNVFAL